MLEDLTAGNNVIEFYASIENPQNTSQRVQVVTNRFLAQKVDQLSQEQQMKPLSKKQPDGFKTGVNKLDQNQIKKMNEAGKDAKEIRLA